MTIRPWNDPAGSTANAVPVVLILKKTQGSVWSEAGRTPLCPTVGWLRDNYGAGQYELRLKLGNRIVCMANAECVAAPAALLSRPEAVGLAPRGAAMLSHTGAARRAIGGAW
jgi:hypothetical protein